MSDERFEEMDDAQRALALKLRAALRDSERVDAATAARLAGARARAVAATGRATRPAWLWASGGLAAAAVLAALLVVQTGSLTPGRADTADAATADAIDVLTDDLGADFYEDLELYRWLAEDGRA